MSNKNNFVYVAGPDVFYPDASQRADKARDIANTYGFTPLIPMDNDIDGNGKTPSQIQSEIYKKNKIMIDKAGIIIANITPFRGPSADSGTVWEIGCGVGQGKPVFAFTDDMRDYKSRVKPDGMMIEDFGSVDNLMITCSVKSISPSIEEAFQRAALYVAELENKQSNSITNTPKPK